MEIGVEDARLSFEPLEKSSEETQVRVSYRDLHFTGAVTMSDRSWSIPAGGRPQQFFRELANRWRGWEREMSWTDISYGFSVTARHDGISRVTFEVTLRQEAGPWISGSLTGAVVVEPGQLDEIATGIEALFDRGWHRT